MSWNSFKLVYGAAPRLLKGFLMYPAPIIREMKEAKRQIQAIKQVANELAYHIPEYQEGMPYCKSKEKYLRSTYLCEPNAPEIIAMANKLGAFQKSGREYAEACYCFVNKNIDFTVFQLPSGAVRTLHSGRGFCLDMASLFIALCRSGGIPARYMMYSDAWVEPVYEMLTADNSLIKQWYDTIGHWIMHVSAEVLVDGKWLVGEFYFPWALAVGLGLPISHLGDDASGTWCFRVRESIVRYESVPRSTVTAISFALKTFGGLFAGAEARIKEKTDEGKRILKEVGEEEYNRIIKQTYKAILPEVSTKLYKALELVEKQ